MPRLTIPGGWDREDVCAAQHALVIRELMEDASTPVGPYAAFRWAMKEIEQKYISFNDGVSLLDAGCGVGHYAVLCERFYPRVHYHGTDLSDIMTVYARQLAPLATFSVCEFSDNKFCNFDIVLTGQTIEQTDDPLGALDLLLTCAKHYVILNRIRLTKDKSHRIEESTYCGNMGRTWLWNLDEITRFIEERAVIVAQNDTWATDQITFVVERRPNDKCTKLCGCTCAALDTISPS